MPGPFDLRVRILRRPRQFDTGLFCQDDGIVRFRADDRAYLRLPARDAQRGFVNIAHRRLATDRSIPRARRGCSNALGQQGSRIDVGPRYFADDIEGIHLREQRRAGVLFCFAQRTLHQRNRLETFGRILGAVGDLAGADDDGNALGLHDERLLVVLPMTVVEWAVAIDEESKLLDHIGEGLR